MLNYCEAHLAVYDKNKQNRKYYVQITPKLSIYENPDSLIIDYICTCLIIYIVVVCLLWVPIWTDPVILKMIFHTIIEKEFTLRVEGYIAYSV